MGRGRSPGHRAQGATAPVLREAEQGARAGGEALAVMVPLELGRDRRCQAEDPATKRSHANRHIARSHQPPVNKTGVQRAEPSRALPRKGGFGWVRLSYR
ncbi:hypothetical protein AMS66_26600 [Paenibacillus xylanivorans]|uniref:Uncharacterized protein n=1 Tax=Paenibacillus xylanivorans TaxID=1705561 RepID=A0A0N0UGR5_9BACL|nr:hypothetical protein AMS66_26600 [Paenibacillus xylanivorans]